MEIWKEVNSYAGLYWVSDQGYVKNRHGRILKPEIRRGYYSVDLRKNDIRKKVRIHRLVAEAFISNPLHLPMINHKDENKLNNTVSNLEWCDCTYNTHYSKHEDLSVYCFDLDQEFRSASEAAVHTGICRTSILKACRGQLQSAGGKWWCYSRDRDTKFPPR
jgi:hypothetical protein